MTREEAIIYGKEQLAIFGGEHREFIEMSIKALEQEPCEDCISREEFIKRYRAWHYTEYGCKPSYDTIAIMLANSMPSVKQEPKTGHWIMHIDDLFPTESTMECSECGEHQPLTIDDNYCPNCGAKMESEG